MLSTRARLQRLRKTHAFHQGTTSGSRKNSCFVSGHDFSRAVKAQKLMGFSPCIQPERQNNRAFPRRLKGPTSSSGRGGVALDNDVDQVTQLLKAMRAGDGQAADRLMPLIYAELHRLAKAYMRRERPDHTLQATALINEAFLRLVREDVDWNSRAHFIGLAAHVMRRVLVDYARARNAEKRGGALTQVEIHEEVAISPQQLDEVVELDEALEKLEQEKPRQARVVELRYFGGLSVEQVATLLEIAPRSVKRDWALARIYLYRELRPRRLQIDGDEK
jgi:RNA polymerase sigma-70 factor (ECF subfamily)